MTTITTHRPSSWTRWVQPAAAGWALLYGALGIFWTLGGPGFPFGKAADRGYGESILGTVDPRLLAPSIAVASLLAAAAVLALRGANALAKTAFGYLVLLGVSLLVVIPDRRPLIAVAYAPILLVGAPFGWPPGVSFLDAIPWPVLNQLVLMVGGVLLLGAALAYRRGIRQDEAAPWTTPAAVRCWGAWVVGIAVAIPVLYAATRWAWALGIPLGISEEFLRQGQESGLWIAGAGLASFAVVGALLTLGLWQGWGELFPRWVPLLGGRRVPPNLAIVPASIVAVFVTSAGLEYWRLALGGPMAMEMSWTTLGPELLWPFWGVALGAAALAYRLRRRASQT